MSIKINPDIVKPKNAARLSDIPRVIDVMRYRINAMNSLLLFNNCAITTQENSASKVHPRSK